MAGHKKKGMKAKGMKRGGASRSARTRVDPRGVQRQAPLDAPRGPKKKKKPMNPTKPRIPDPLEGGPSNSGSRRMQKGGAMKAKGMMAGGSMKAKGMAKGGKMATKGYAKGGAAGGMRKPSSKNSGLYGR